MYLLKRIFYFIASRKNNIVRTCFVFSTLYFSDSEQRHVNGCRRTTVVKKLLPRRNKRWKNENCLKPLINEKIERTFKALYGRNIHPPSFSSSMSLCPHQIITCTYCGTYQRNECIYIFIS